MRWEWGGEGMSIALESKCEIPSFWCLCKHLLCMIDISELHQPLYGFLEPKWAFMSWRLYSHGRGCLESTF